MSIADEVTLQTDPNADDILFVSKDNPVAADTNAGTIEAPLASIDGAIAKAATSKVPMTLLVTTGTYTVQHAIDMSHVAQILGGYSPTFDTDKAGFTSLDFSTVTDQILIHIKPAVTNKINTPITLQHLSMKVGDRSDYFYSIVFEEDWPHTATHKISIAANEIVGNIAVNKPGVVDFAIHDNTIHGASGGLVGETNTDGSYNTTIFDCCMTGSVEVKNNQVFGGTNLGSKMFQVQTVLNLMDGPDSSLSDLDIAMDIEGNLFACGQTVDCINVILGSNMLGAKTQTVLFDNNTLSGAQPPIGTANSSFTGFWAWWEAGSVQFTNNEVHIPDVQTASGFDAQAPSIDSTGSPIYLVKGNTFVVDNTAHIFAKANSVSGLRLADLIGTFEISGNTFLLDSFGIPIWRILYKDAHPENSAIIQSDVAVVEKLY